MSVWVAAGAGQQVPPELHVRDVLPVPGGGGDVPAAAGGPGHGAPLRASQGERRRSGKPVAAASYAPPLPSLVKGWDWLQTHSTGSQRASRDPPPSSHSCRRPPPTSQDTNLLRYVTVFVIGYLQSGVCGTSFDTGLYGRRLAMRCSASASAQSGADGGSWSWGHHPLFTVCLAAGARRGTERDGKWNFRVSLHRVSIGGRSLMSVLDTHAESRQI